MKTSITLLSLVAVALANVLPETQNEEIEGNINAAQSMNNYYANLLSMSPGDREMMGMSMNFQGNPMAMQGQFSPMDYMNFPGMGMGMGYPNMMMPGMNFPSMNSYPGYPGHYQGVSKTNACGCSSSCGMPCLWWSCTPCIPCPPCQEETTTTELTTTTTQPTLPTFPQELETTTLPPSNNCPCVRFCPPCMPWFPCSPCSCPCQTNPPDNDTPPTTVTTTTPTTTTTKLTTVTQEITQRPPDNCVPCTPCVPCGPIWWMPCGNCNCVNGCQTSAPVTTTTALPTINPNRLPPRDNNSNRNNCQCICAPCPPWSDCPPCPKNCPCY